MSSFNQDFFDEILENEVTDNGFLGEEPQAFRQPYNPGGVIQNNFGEAFGDAPSSRVTVRRSVLMPSSRLPVAALDPMNALYLLGGSIRVTGADNSSRHHKILPTLRVRPARA